MKVGFAQLNPRVGDTAYNLNQITRSIETAIKQKARLVVFPELAITGYPLRDLLAQTWLVEENLRALNSLLPLSRSIGVLIGCIDKNPNVAGKPYFNCAALLDGGSTVAKYHKQLLPYYDVFEEERFFEAGSTPGIFTMDGRRIGVTVCEDIWNGFLPRPYRTDPITAYAEQNLDLFINLSASPFHIGKPELRVKVAQSVAKIVNAPLILCNQMGGNDELLFDGSSFAMFKDGSLHSSIAPFEMGDATFDLGNSNGAPKGAMPIAQLSPTAWIHKALVLGIQDYAGKCGTAKLCVGLSGGIDSAVVAALAVEAVGKANIFALTMPSRFSSKESQQDAIQIANNLSIDFKIIEIDSFYQRYIEKLGDSFGSPLNSLTRENIQPRIRMTLLMALANEKGALLLNTSNKSEIATGFATLYGDSAGALSVIGDLTKHEVYELGRELCGTTELIPKSVFERAPSAELREDQKDQDTLPPYDELDRLVAAALDPSQSDFVNRGISKANSDKFKALYLATEYKRRQFPPILRVSSTAFGMGRRMPVAAKLGLNYSLNV